MGMSLYGSNEPTLNFETLIDQSYHVALETIFYTTFHIAFAFKLLVIPLHTWLPDTHGETHYITCMLLARILLKMGAYGLVRINMDFFPRPLHILPLIDDIMFYSNNLCRFNIFWSM